MNDGANAVTEVAGGLACDIRNNCPSPKLTPSAQPSSTSAGPSSSPKTTSAASSSSTTTTGPSSLSKSTLALSSVEPTSAVFTQANGAIAPAVAGVPTVYVAAPTNLVAPQPVVVTLPASYIVTGAGNVQAAQPVEQMPQSGDSAMSTIPGANVGAAQIVAQKGDLMASASVMAFASSTAASDTMEPEQPKAQKQGSVSTSAGLRVQNSVKIPDPSETNGGPDYETETTASPASQSVGDAYLGGDLLYTSSDTVPVLTTSKSIPTSASEKKAASDDEDQSPKNTDTESPTADLVARTLGFHLANSYTLQPSTRNTVDLTTPASITVGSPVLQIRTTLHTVTISARQQGPSLGPRLAR